MYEFLTCNDRGAVTVDWVALTAGIVALGIVVVYVIMGDSAGYLMDEFDDLNASYAASAQQVQDVVQNQQANANQ